MAYLSNPGVAYFLVVLGVTLIILGLIHSKKITLNMGVALFFVATMLGFLYLRVNPWAYLAVALSPVLVSTAVRQGRAHNPLYIIAIFMLALGSFFIFVDQDNNALVTNRSAWVSVLSAAILWISIEGLRNARGVSLSSDPTSVVGLIGETQTDIEVHAAGSVLIEGEVWQARSKRPIPAGSTVRVLRQDGFWLTVIQVGKIPEK